MDHQLVVSLIVFTVFREGSSILCHTSTPDSQCATGTANCAIRQDSSGSEVKVEKYCNNGVVGCTVSDKIITCECNTNNCNIDLKSAGYTGDSGSEAGTGTGTES